MVEKVAVLWLLVPQLGLTWSEGVQLALTSAVLIIMEDTQGKINGAVVDFIMVISPQLSCSIEVAGLFLK